MSGEFQVVQQRREHLQALRDEVQGRHVAKQAGIEICNWFSDQLDDVLRQMMTSAVDKVSTAKDGVYSLIAVGGNGRRRPAPFSDVDLLLVAPKADVASMEAVLSEFVRDCWDTGFQLGHSIRTPEDVLAFAREDVQFATSLVDMRHITGSSVVFERLRKKVSAKVFRDPVDRFVDLCVASRREEWLARGDSVNQLEPDVKRSPGGLRDLHLLKWVAYAQSGDSNLASLLEMGKLRTHELVLLHKADEFLTSLRLELHGRAGLKQDVLTRDLQLEIVRSRDGVVVDDHRKAVESFMQEYFSQTSQVAEIARRVTETKHRPSLFGRLKNVFSNRQASQGLAIVDGVLDVRSDDLTDIQRNPEKMMDIFLVAAEQQVPLSAPLRKSLSKIALRLPTDPSRKSCSTFRAILRSGLGLPAALRAMYETRVLDWLVPAVSEIRCLMQFNQYHSYTVDEHTLKTIDEVVKFADDESPFGTAYESVRHKATLHLSLILHDIAKGRDGDHSIEGEKIAEEVAVRLQTPENKKRMMMFLVRQHLVMPDLAFRRDITDPVLLVDFARLVGAPELLRMLYVLSVADIRAVGPGVWTDWKGDLMADLYNRTMLILSGRPINHLEREKLSLIRQHLRSTLKAPVKNSDDSEASGQLSGELPEWIDQQLDALPPFYLMTEEPDRIAQDLNEIKALSATEVAVYGAYDQETDTVAYRVFASPRYEPSSFHRVTGVLSGLRMDIHSAQSCTTAGGTLIGSYIVSDNDFVGAVADSRISEVCAALNDVLTGKLSVDSIFRRSGLFKSRKQDRIIAPVAPHVSIDNDCSEKHTVIDVFATDTPGLLYTLALTLYQHDLSVELTRIATNVDQVVDVFYVVDNDGLKLESPQKIDRLHEALMQELSELHQTAVSN